MLSCIRSWIAPIVGLSMLACTSSSADEGASEASTETNGTETGEPDTGETETGETGDELMCGGDMLTVAGQSLQILDVAFGGIGIGGGEFADVAEIQLEGNVILALQFLQDTSSGDTITIVADETATQGAYVINYAGFEGGPQDLCDRNGQNGAVSGSFFIEQLVRDENDAIQAICGELDLQFTNCDFTDLGIMGDVTFTGSYR
jgi:hypothetical protein